MENNLQEIFNLKENEQGDIAVSGRELHKGLEVDSHYKDWIKRMLSYGFEENSDFVATAQKRATNNPKNPWTTESNHILTLDTAKEISMLQRTEIGKQVRQYFISIEKKYTQYMKEEYYTLETEKAELLKENNDLQDRIIYLESIKDNESLVDSEKWKQEAVTIISGIGIKRAFSEKNIPQCTSWTYSESYKSLNMKARTNIKARLTRYKTRLLSQGQPKTEVDKISLLDFIAQDQNLIAKYTESLEELALKYNFFINQDKTEFNKFTLRLEEKNENVLPFKDYFGGLPGME